MPTLRFQFHLPGFRLLQLLQTNDHIVVRAQAKAKNASCPSCLTRSSSVHSYYHRKANDLPLAQHRLILLLRVRRFRCRNPQCTRCTFSEPLDKLLSGYARRTNRLTSALREVGFALGGRAGARLAERLRLPTSYRTLLRLLHHTSITAPQALTVVGVDDWAFRKGQTYGTLIVDLVSRQPVALLPDRTAATLATWLRAHPTIRILTRDRATEYAQGMSAGAPEALQIADRWHLLCNLQQALERLCLQHRKRIGQLAQQHNYWPYAPAFGRSPAELEVPRQKQRRRQALYKKVIKLYQQGCKLQQIARELGISRATVRRYVHEGGLPYRQHRSRHPSLLAPYLDYLQRRLEEGCENAHQLWREIQDQGYRGSVRQVSRWVYLRRSQPAPSTPSAYRARITQLSETRARASGRWLPSPRRLAWLLKARPIELQGEERSLVACFCKDKLLEQAYRLAQQFVAMLSGEGSARSFAQWYDACDVSGLDPLRGLARNLFADRSAVVAALTMPWSNGQVEGQINRLKLIKRQMYGRASFRLLERLVLYRSDEHEI